jgi:hypothetical protein
MNYQQAPAAPDFQQPAPPAYSGYQQPAPFAPNYPQANQPGYNQSPQPYPTPVYQPQQAPWAGAPAAPAAARPRKRRTGLIIGLVVLLLLVVGGGSLYFFVIRSTPEKTLQAYCNAVQNSNAQETFNQLSANAQSKTSVANFDKAFQVIKAAPINGIKSCTYNNVQQNGSSATATVVLTFGNSAAPASPSQVTLVDENGTWKLDTSRTTP